MYINPAGVMFGQGQLPGFLEHQLPLEYAITIVLSFSIWQGTGD